MKREFDNIVEGVFDRLKAKAAGAVGGAKAAAGALGQAAMGKQTGSIKQAFQQGKQDTATQSLVGNKIAQLEKSVDSLETDLLKLTGLNIEEFSKQFPDAIKFVDNIVTNIEAMKGIANKSQAQTQQEPAADNTQAQPA